MVITAIVPFLHTGTCPRLETPIVTVETAASLGIPQVCTSKTVSLLDDNMIKKL